MTLSVARSKDSALRAGTTLAIDHLQGLTNKYGALRAVQLLGGVPVLGGDSARLLAFDPLLWDSAISNGLPIEAFECVLQAVRVARRRLLEDLGFSVRSLQRRRASGSTRLDPDSAARLVALAYLIEKTVETLGSLDAADLWLSTPNSALDGAAPIDLAGRPLGNQAVMSLLASIEHGMFS